MPFRLLETKFCKNKGGIKVYTLYNVEVCILAFFIYHHKAYICDSKAIIKIPHESGSYYFFVRKYNNFRYCIPHQFESSFVVRTKKDSVQWKCMLPQSILSDARILLTRFYPQQYYPEMLRLVIH